MRRACYVTRHVSNMTDYEEKIADISNPMVYGRAHSMINVLVDTFLVISETVG